MHKIIVSVFAFLVISIIVGAGIPKYIVYCSTLSGEARLREAESSKKIAIEEAKAKMESAQMLAKAEVERAKGVAEANKIIGESLKGNESYLHYLWIDSLHDTNADVVYIPTEAGLPILEAQRKTTVIVPSKPEQ